jgi:hypothetical protein
MSSGLSVAAFSLLAVLSLFTAERSKGQSFCALLIVSEDRHSPELTQRTEALTPISALRSFLRNALMTMTNSFRVEVGCSNTIGSSVVTCRSGANPHLDAARRRQAA